METDLRGRLLPVQACTSLLYQLQVLTSWSSFPCSARSVERALTLLQPAKQSHLSKPEFIDHGRKLPETTMHLKNKNKRLLLSMH